jgi:hypothetical protein
LSKARTKKLELMEEKVKLWKEKAKMMNLIKEMDDLKMETFDGEWDEHDLLDGLMLEILASGLVDDDVEMVSSEDGGSAVEKMLVDDDDADTGMCLESGQHEDEESEDNMDVNERYEEI